MLKGKIKYHDTSREIQLVQNRKKLMAVRRIEEAILDPLYEQPALEAW